jgi:hypothetical protein
MSRAIPEKDLPVFWPFFPYDLMPIKEGEHAYVVFEDNNNRTHGLWLTRAPDPMKSENLNLVPGEKKYEENDDNNASGVEIQKAAQGSDSANINQAKQSEEFTKEEVVPFTARIGDRAINGSNNTLSGQEKESGTIFLITGRKDKEKINLKDDKAFIVISSKTDIDDNLDIKPGDKKSGVSTVAIKSDEIRIIARKGMKVVVEEGDVFISAKGKLTVETEKETILKTKDKLNIEASSDINIKSSSKVVLDCNQIDIGPGGEKAILGETIQGIVKDYIATNTTHTHPSAMGPTGPSVDLIPARVQAEIKLAMCLSNTVKIK